MNSIVVSTNQYIDDLRNFLDWRKFHFLHRSDNEIEIMLEDEEEKKKEIPFAISSFLTMKAFEKELNKFIESEELSEEKAKEFSNRVEDEFLDSKYWVPLTKVLINDYLKNNNFINLETFMLFNMKGFKEEIHSFFDYLLNEDHSEDDLSEEEISDMQIQELFEIIRNDLIKKGVNMKNFEKLHVFQEKERLVFKNGVKEKLDKSFFAKNIGSFFQITAQEDVPHYMLDSMYLMVLISIFKPKTIIIHQNISVEAVEAIQKEITDLKKKFPDLDVQFCKGCKECQ